MRCNWSSSPVGGALLQLVRLEAALLAQAAVFVQLRSHFDSISPDTGETVQRASPLKRGWPTAALAHSLRFHVESRN